MSAPRIVALVLGSTVTVGAILFIALTTREDRRVAPSPRTTLITVEGWSYLDGEVQRTDDGGYLTPTGFSIEQPGLVVEVEPGSTFHFEEGVPILDEGELQVRATTESVFGPYGIPAGSDLRFGSDKIIVGGRGVFIDGTRIPPGTILDRPGRGPSPTRPPIDLQAAGVVVDAATGSPITGAALRITFSDQPNGYPAFSPEAVVEAITDPSGRFQIPVFRPEDPRTRIRVEVVAEEFAPGVALVEEECTLGGEWPFLRIPLRRTWLTETFFVDGDRNPFPGATVRSRRRADPYLPEEGPSLLRLENEEVALRTTDAFGRITYIHGVEELQLIDPLIVPYPHWLPRPMWAGEVDEDGVDATGTPVPIYTLHLVPETIETFELVDADGDPVALTTIELTIRENARTFRVRTDLAGSFRFGVAEREPKAPQLVDLPKVVTLRVLDASFRDASREFFIPGHPSRLWLDGRPAPRLSLRLVQLDDQNQPRPVPAEQVRISADLTSVHRDREGYAEFVGQLPPEGQRLIVAARDAAPVEVITPARSDQATTLDLGDLVVPARDAVSVLLSGVGPSDLEGAVLEISGEEFAASRFRTPISGGSRALVGGLDPMRFYRFRVTGPWITEVHGEFRLANEDTDVGLAIPLFTSDANRFITTGRVVGIPPWETPRYRIIERIRRGDEQDPVIRASYRLAPDGTFGSEDWVEGARLFEALALGSGALFADAEPRGRTEPGYVMLGTLAPTEPRVARFYFRIEGAGPTLPPEAWLEGFQDRDHEVVDLVRQFPIGKPPYLEARFLLPGEYALHWESIEEEDGVYPLVVTVDGRFSEAMIELPAAERNEVIVTVLSASGMPVANALVTSTPIDPNLGEGTPSGGEELGAGIYLIETVYDVPNRIHVEPPTSERIPMYVTVPAGGEITRPIQLVRAASLASELRDLGQRRLDGTGRVIPIVAPAGKEWPEGTTIRYGETAPFSLDHGRFKVGGLASGIHIREIRHDSTATATVVILDLAPGENEAEPFFLEERRTLKGVVLLDGGEGAAGAEVVLMHPSAAHRYPGRDLDPRNIRRRVESGAGGVFSIDLTGIDRNAVLALVAKMPGSTPAVLSPVDLDGPPATLFLADGNELVIAAIRQGSGSDPLQDRFRLSFISDDPEEGKIDLGEILTREPTTYRDVRPGRYQLDWGPTALPAGIVGPSAETAVIPGFRKNLRLEIDADFRPAIARLNGKLLDSGFAIVTDDPSDPGRLRAAPVRNGRVQLPLPSGASTVCISLIPQSASRHTLDFEVGTARPIPLSGGELLGGDPIQIERDAYDLIFQLGESVLNDPDAWIELPRWVWRGREWRTDGTIALRARARLVVPLLSPGFYPYKAVSRGPGGWSIHLGAEIVDDDVTILVSH